MTVTARLGARRWPGEQRSCRCRRTALHHCPSQAYVGPVYRSSAIIDRSKSLNTSLCIPPQRAAPSCPRSLAHQAPPPLSIYASTPAIQHVQRQSTPPSIQSGLRAGIGPTKLKRLSRSPAIETSPRSASRYGLRLVLPLLLLIPGGANIPMSPAPHDPSA
jgi:hypothetical protein